MLRVHEFSVLHLSLLNLAQLRNHRWLRQFYDLNAVNIPCYTTPARTATVIPLLFLRSPDALNAGAFQSSVDRQGCFGKACLDPARGDDVRTAVALHALRSKLPLQLY